MHRSIQAGAAALAFTLLIGQVTDRTTGQPLHGVHFDLAQGQKSLHSTSDADGRFSFKNVTPGKHTLRYSSSDVPPQKISVTVHGAKQEVTITACSMTLDYSCTGPGGGG